MTARLPRLTTPLLAALTIASMLPLFTEGALHEALGAAAAAAALLHCARNAWWFRGGMRSMLRSGKVISTLLTAGLGAAFATLVLTGLMSSRHVTPFLRVSAGLGDVMHLHLLCGYATLILAGLHLGVRFAAIERRPSLRGRLLRVAALALALLGAEAALRLEVPAIIAGVLPYAAVDYERGPWAAFLDHAALVVLAAVAASLAGEIRKRLARRRSSRPRAPASASAMPGRTTLPAATE